MEGVVPCHPASFEWLLSDLPTTEGRCEIAPESQLARQEHQPPIGGLVTLRPFHWPVSGHSALSFVSVLEERGGAFWCLR